MTATLPRRIPPGPPRRAAIRMLMTMNSDRLGMMTQAAAEYGDAVKIPVGPKTLYFFNHPAYAKHVLADNAANYHKGIGLIHAKRALGDGLLTSEGALWRKQRTVIQPAFQSKRIAAQAGAVAEEGAKFVARLRAHAGGGPVDLVDELNHLTLGVLGRTLLDADLGVFDSIGHNFSSIQDQAMFELVTLGAVPTWIPLPKQMRFRRARRDLERIVRELVSERTSIGVDTREDVLSRLILSTGDEADPRVGRRRLRDELVTLLLAGHETTASTLGWAMYEIGAHPEVAERLRAEATATLGDRLPTMDDLNGLRYTSRVVDEVMRLHPPVWLLPRKALAADTIGEYSVPSGADVLICPYTLHRHPDFWDDPDLFDPDRFEANRSADRSRYAYIPFGAGPRFCVGNHLGTMEAVMVIAMIMRELRLTKLDSHRVIAQPMLSLRIRDGLPVTVTTV